MGCRSAFAPHANLLTGITARHSQSSSDGRTWSHSDALNLDLWWDDGQIRFRGPQAQGAAGGARGGARREAITLPPIHENHRLAGIPSRSLLALPTATYLPVFWEGCKVVVIESLENLP